LGAVQDACQTALSAHWHIRIQDPITTEDSEPEPDLVIARGKRRDYLSRHPFPQETALVVEVADTTLLEDQTVKARIYARAGIKVYWIVNLVEMQIEVYTNPVRRGKDPRYRQQQNYGIGDEVPLVIDGKELARIAVRDLLP
jgi:Uma2 family endonuclease